MTDCNQTPAELTYKKNMSIVQANELIRSKQDPLTPNEAKLVRLMIAQVLKDDTDFRTFKCHIKDLAEYLNISKDNIYRDIQKLSKDLMRRSIFILDAAQPYKRGKPNYKIFHWVDYIEYTDGYITIKLSDNLKPYLIGLEALFSVYGYDVARGLPNNYAIRLYELIASYQNMMVRPSYESSHTDIPHEKNEFVFSVDWLRERFCCTDKYKNTNGFVARVIDDSVKSIVQNTLMRLSYRIVKPGREITHIIFKLHDWDDGEFTEYMKKLKGVEPDALPEKT